MKHCLVVDDSDIIRKIANRVLEDMNITSTDAETGHEALNMCRRAMPDCILIDWHMPSMPPHDFIQLVRAEPGGEEPIIIYCTTENDPEDIERAFAVGADDYLMKPFDKEALVRKLHDAGLSS